jgi:hypothetical protein
MKLTWSFGSKALVWCLALIVAASATTLSAQTAKQGAAKIIRIKGAARYTMGDNKWHPLNEGDILKPGAVIQTASSSQVDLLLSDQENVGEQTITPAIVYRPETEARVNAVRMYENTVLGVDKLTWMGTGVDMVTETQLDLRAGRIFGTVKKLSGASRYEVKIPNGVAGIRGTIYMLEASGLVKVLVGTVIISYVKPDGTIVTQVVMGGQMYDPVTGLLVAIPNATKQEMAAAGRECGWGPPPGPFPFPPDHTHHWISPTHGWPGPPWGGWVGWW